MDFITYALVYSFLNVILFITLYLIFGEKVPTIKINKPDTLPEVNYYIDKNNYVFKKEYKFKSINVGIRYPFLFIFFPCFALLFFDYVYYDRVWYPSFNYKCFSLYTTSEDIKEFWLAEYKIYIDEKDRVNEIDKHRKNINKES